MKETRRLAGRGERNDTERQTHDIQTEPTTYRQRERERDGPRQAGRKNEPAT